MTGNHKSEKWLAYETLKEEIQEKIRKLEEERHTVELWPSTEWGRRRRKRQVTVSPPYVVYMLPDADIMEDWRLALGHRRVLSFACLLVSHRCQSAITK
ncbi:unnamed protein product [Chilo suppressalis]|uniref:Breast cancer metastasis-suppressor 1-like protein n=1 Tax=Chilo suppressalis TaxID=168631 RepID=A0ABN8AYH7_CHISP|nr:unnamed protein product [Chilo suppressalis]